jgi:hypothetical protein
MSGSQIDCQFSGEIPEYWYVRHLRSLLPILPQYRRLFKGAQAELVFIKCEVEECGNFRSGGSYTKFDDVWELAWKFKGDVDSWWASQKQEGYFLRIRYTYELRVSDPALQGEVGGVYTSTSVNKNDVIRRIKRMIGPGLVVRSECSTSRSAIFKAWKRFKYAGAKQAAMDHWERKARKDAEALSAT